MRSVEAVVTRVAVLLLALILAVPLTGAAGPGLPASSDPVVPAAGGAAITPAITPGIDPAVGGPAPYDRWFAWTESVPLPVLVEAALSEAPTAGQALLPRPDALAAYPAVGEATQREAWRAWWLSSLVAAARTPHVPVAAAGSTDPAAAQQGGTSTPTGGVNVDSLGDPRGLTSLWRLEAHGAPLQVLPAGPDGATYLVTDLGVLHLREGAQRPDWILRVSGVPGRAEVTPAGETGDRDLVIGARDPLFGTGPSIHVVDGADGRLLWRGLSGPEALLYWRLTDVDGDGNFDILGVDVSGNITAVKLDGTQIYRTPLPLPELPSTDDLPVLPMFLALALERTGGVAFGDATADGTLDFFTTGVYWASTQGFLEPSLLYVSLVDGANGETAWTSLVEPELSGAFRMAFPSAAGDLDGDGAADPVVMQLSFVGIGVMGFGFTNFVFSGATGMLLARDDGRPVCLVSCESVEPMYEPVAVMDLEGDGSFVLVGLERPSSPFEVPDHIVVRELLPVPGAPTIVVERFEIALEAAGLPYPGHLALRTDESTGAMTLFLYSAPRFASVGETGTIYVLESGGLRALSPPEPLGHFDVDTATGQHYAWTLRDDRWTPADAEGAPTGNGTLLLRSVTPIVFHDQDGDRVPDALLRRSLGYHWVSGRSGEVVEHVPRPLGARLAAVTEGPEGPLLVEREGVDLHLFDVLRQQVVWTVAEEVFAGSHLAAAADFSGAGNVEILFRELPVFSFDTLPEQGQQPERSDPRWWVYAPESGETLWEVTGEMRVSVRDVIPERTGMELLVQEEQGQGEVLRLQVAGESGARWSYTTTSGLSVENAERGRLLIVEHGDDPGYVVVDGLRGTTITEVRSEGGVWARLAPLRSGAPHLVYSYDEEIPGLAGALMQRLVVVDTDTGQKQSEVRLVDPEVRTVTVHFFGFEFTYTTIQYAYAGPLVGDWDGDGWGEITLREGGWPLVRSARTGDVLALSPRQGAFIDAVDLNGDGRQELAMQSSDGGSLRLFAFDPSQVLEREDPLQRVDDEDLEGGGTNETFFERERAPAPALLLVLGAVLALAAVARRRRVQ